MWQPKSLRKQEQFLVWYKIEKAQKRRKKRKEKRWYTVVLYLYRVKRRGRKADDAKEISTERLVRIIYKKTKGRKSNGSQVLKWRQPCATVGRNIKETMEKKQKKKRS
ncbi:hypothetical protein TWF730_003900 [Orbilia blumenaviensis]|uniref:Uncharacterized protein n=1 Tax=Orbilia blumenaviensis TaxID=1796055 RepID=A0AAV9U195_9PEZI